MDRWGDWKNCSGSNVTVQVKVSTQNSPSLTDYALGGSVCKAVLASLEFLRG